MSAVSILIARRLTESVLLHSMYFQAIRKDTDLEI